MINFLNPRSAYIINIEDEQRNEKKREYKQQADKHLYEGVVTELIGLNEEAKRSYSLSVEQLAKAELIDDGIDLNNPILKTHKPKVLFKELKNRGYEGILTQLEQKSVDGYFDDKYEAKKVTCEEVGKSGEAAFKYKAHIDKRFNTSIDEINQYTGYNNPLGVSDDYIREHQYESMKKGRAREQIKKAVKRL